MTRASGCFGLLLLLGGVSANGHEIGTSRVAVQFGEGRTYQVDLVTDATALAEKLEASIGRTLPASTE